MATGLGKTWLSAFDSNRPEYRRILFVAHREEILAQAMRSFRRIRPNAHMGHYGGGIREGDADILFASIQTLGRANHLGQFNPTAFDYIVVDEFHHAWAKSYRRVIRHFQPAFLLGMTATPERADGGDLLGLCQENLVYRQDIADGIRLGLLCPFHYFGVPDDVDYSNIPWRSTHFDEEALTKAVATQRRAQNALGQYRKHGGSRTLAFCVSQRHADFMAEYFRNNGLKSVAVHSGQSSAPRAVSLEHLRQRKIDVIFAVDMFNEGVDLPELDTVMMLRPTESPVIWIQQFGRGLRLSGNDKTLKVIDYIGNHRVFLIKPRTLFRLGSGREELLFLLKKLRSGNVELPPGCAVIYELEAIDILKELVQRAGPANQIVNYYEEFKEVHGERPTIAETFHDGYAPRSIRKDHGSWWRFVDSMGDLSESQRRAFEVAGKFLEHLEITQMTKSYKMVVLRAMLDADRFPGEISIHELAAGFERIAGVSSVLQSDIGEAFGNAAALRCLIETNPIDAWVGGRGTGGIAFFAYERGVLKTTFTLPPEDRPAFQELLAEIVDWRLAEYLQRTGRIAVAETQIICKVSHSGGRPLLFLPPRSANPGIPSGWTNVSVEGESFEANFVKVAVNVIRRIGSSKNELPQILRRWFGPKAGHPGTEHHVAFVNGESEIEMKPYTLAP